VPPMPRLAASGQFRRRALLSLVRDGPDISAIRESYDGGLFYLECHERTLRGYSKIGRAQLGRNMFRLELAGEPAETVQIGFQADSARYNQLRRVLKIICVQVC
jgi:hypothetical protein